MLSKKLQRSFHGDLDEEIYTEFLKCLTIGAEKIARNIK
jgi:hypothetical protein